MSLPAWEEVESILAELDAPTGPAGCHGLLCGLLCARAAGPATLWLREAMERTPEAPPPPPLDELFRETSRQLDDETFGFELMLPSDEAPLAERAAALAAWCTSFAYGIGASGVAESSLSTESAEFLADVTEIARAEPDGDTPSEADEEAYAEIVEYLRVGVLIMRNAPPTATAEP